MTKHIIIIMFIYTLTHTHTCIHACIHTHTHACTHECMVNGSTCCIGKQLLHLQLCRLYTFIYMFIVCYLVERESRDRHRDQIATRLHSVMWECLCIPRHMYCSVMALFMHTTIQACFLSFFYNPCMSLFI